jgi:hypothetical protein
MIRILTASLPGTEKKNEKDGELSKANFSTFSSKFRDRERGR